ncbi:MAG: phospho-sugar mutase [Burkholderiales bacterium]
MTSRDKYMFWLNNTYFDTETRKQLADIKYNAAEIEDRFGKELEFGTGGLRGIVGAGTNRMNVYIVRKVSQGLANHIAKKNAVCSGVVVGYDSRRQSELFAREAAGVFAGNGIPVYLFSEPRPTPMLSFAIRHLNAAAGVMITASHNPKEYNGYKVYSEDGAQLSDASAISGEIAGINDITRIPTVDSGAAVNTGLIRMLGKEMDDAYIYYVKSLMVCGDNVIKYADRIRIVYTPLHGTGGKMVTRMFSETGFNDYHVAEEQYLPDGGFPTLDTTLNPEDKEVYKRALMLAKEKNADLILATDPDCDRVGVMVKREKNRYVLLSGNEVGALMLNYILSTKHHEATDNGFIAKTIVTTRLADMIARHFGIDVEEVLTGFKYIGALIRTLHDTGKKNFIFGMEDSCGYLIGTDVRDKDGVIGCMLITQAAAWYKSKGLSLYEGLKQLYRQYGWFSGELVTYPVRTDQQLALLKQALFCDTEGAMFKELGITAVRNYSLKLRRDAISGVCTELKLPKTEAVYYELPDGWFCIRPSGTESKIKIYFEAYGDSQKSVKKVLLKIKRCVLRKITKHIKLS